MKEVKIGIEKIGVGFSGEGVMRCPCARGGATNQKTSQDHLSVSCPLCGGTRTCKRESVRKVYV